MDVRDGLRVETEGDAVSALDELRASGEYTEDITGDACSGDEVAFARAVFSGSFRRAKFDGCEIVIGKIVRDSYGAEKQQHTFTVERADGSTMRIKGRNLYRIRVLSKPRTDAERAAALAEKHERGDSARASRAERRAREWEEGWRP